MTVPLLVYFLNRSGSVIVSEAEDHNLLELTATGVSPTQLAGPITLDPRVIQERVKGWIEDATQREDPISPTEQSSGSKEEGSHSAMDEETVRARGTRVRHEERRTRRHDSSSGNQFPETFRGAIRLIRQIGRTVADEISSGGLNSPIVHRSEAANNSQDVNSILSIMRVKVHQFDRMNVEDWIDKINKFFDLHGVPKVIRLSMVPFHLDGTPSTWFQWMEKGGGFSDWESFLRALRLYFGVSIYDDPLGRIAKLTQIGRVSTFRAEFEGLITQILGVSEQFFINYFMWGLKNEIRRELLLSKPVDLADAMAKAQLFEDRNDDLLGRARNEGVHSAWSPRYSNSATTKTYQGIEFALEIGLVSKKAFIANNRVLANFEVGTSMHLVDQ
ncbi:hypothetical protein G4B88_002938 [Cannabis sativa]|uniref:Retrotransposon gag domain-containing protein n=1 Tax=Cannabis sativa TaxID=3483 RepID=A0A7J6DLX0_CANSA|nr:hypothetical protein G4B88_002938 [Cannabis sativa]